MKNKAKIIFERERLYDFFQKEGEGYMLFCNAKNPSIVTLSMFRHRDYTMDKFGIKFTSTSCRRTVSYQRVWFFEVTDEKKFTLFKLKYGFRMI